MNFEDNITIYLFYNSFADFWNNLSKFCPYENIV